MAPLLPKLRGQFAEFLNESSLARLRIFISPTCVGLWYGHHQRLATISWKHCAVSSVPPKIPLAHNLAFCQWIYLPTGLVVKRTLPIVRILNVLRHRIIIALGGAGMFNLLSIAYAFPPELRCRLTQGRRALPWKPWVYGEEDFHLLYRLLMPCILTSMRSSAPYGTPSTLHTTLSYRVHLTMYTRDFGSIL